MTGMLGCASAYEVELVFVQTRNAAGQLLPAPVQWSQGPLQGVTRVQWGRVINGVSEAVVTIGGPAGVGICCDQVEAIQPEMYEIRIHREGELVWEGPIVDDVETSQGQPYLIHARDVLTWFEPEDGRPNLVNISYDDQDPTLIARRIIERNLTDEWATPPDYPMVLDHLHIEPVGVEVDYKPGLRVDFIINMLQELTDFGLVYTAYCRSIMLIKGADLTTPVIAQITQEDIDAPVEITQAGQEMGTIGIAVRPAADNEDPPALFFYGSKNSAYRPHYRVVDVATNVKNSTASRAARQAIKGRTVPPLVVSMAGGGRLFPTAPIQINEIIPGWTRVDFMTSGRGSQGICTQLRQPMQFSSLSVDWVPGQETVSVAMVPVGEPTDVDPIEGLTNG